LEKDNSGSAMPVRKIPRSYLFVTGIYPSQKNQETLQFESPLEKDLLILLEFDEAVSSFDVQPVHVPVPGNAKPYTPDVLIRYNATVESLAGRKPVLGEVKHTDFLEKQREKNEPKFAAATIFAEERGWEFKVITEKDIRVPRLQNLKFLRAYRDIEVAIADRSRIVDAIEKLGGSANFRELLGEIADSVTAQLMFAPMIWSMVCQKLVKVDLEINFGADPELWLE
jgi:TnsA endonuclease N terminal/TnsA endonuclease C terminal